MGLFFNTDDRFIKPITQSVLLDWRSQGIPCVFSILSLPIGLPVMIQYTRKDSKFIPTRVKVDNRLLIEDGKEIKANKQILKTIESFSNLDYPVLNSKNYEWVDSFIVKGIITWAASNKRIKHNTGFSHKEKSKLVYSTLNEFEMKNRKFPSKEKFLKNMTEKPTLYIYDLNREMLNKFSSIHEIGLMSRSIMTFTHDIDSVSFINIDVVSAYGLTNWTSNYNVRVRNDHKTIISRIGGRNLWFHNKYIVCQTASKERVATLSLESMK